jgi:hypothetical protein
MTVHISPPHKASIVEVIVLVVNLETKINLLYMTYSYVRGPVKSGDKMKTHQNVLETSWKNLYANPKMTENYNTMK